MLDGRVAAPSELAAELKVPIPFVAFHLRQLQRWRCVELVYVEQAVTTLKHYYRSTIAP